MRLPQVIILTGQSAHEILGIRQSLQRV